MNSNRSMPPGVIIPELPYPDVREAVDWLCHNFGFVERLRIQNHRAQLVSGEGSIIVTRGRDANPSCAVMVRVEDVSAHFERVNRSGALILNPLADYPYGERQFTVEDPGGHRWTFSQTIADIDPKTWGGLLFE